MLAAPQRGLAKALLVGGNPPPAPQAQRLLAPRFSVGQAKPTNIQESCRDGAGRSHAAFWRF